MKPTKILKEIDTIDNDKEHNKVLFELGILDDMEDWELYQKQERLIEAAIVDMEPEEYFKLMGKEYIPRPIPQNLYLPPRSAVKQKS